MGFLSLWKQLDFCYLTSYALKAGVMNRDFKNNEKLTITTKKDYKLIVYKNYLQEQLFWLCWLTKGEPPG